MTEADILKITNPTILFSGTEADIRQKFIALSKQWHPDLNINKDTTDIIKQINILYEKALLLVKSSTNNILEHNAVNFGDVKIKYRSKYPFELGTCYISDTIITYVISNTYKKLYDNAIMKILDLKYPSKKMEDEFKRYMPTIFKKFTFEDSHVLIISKTPDLLNLRDVLSYYKNNMSDKHVAWILSRLYNISCFLNFNKLSHNGITLSNCYISPQFHTLTLLGGWFYTTNYDKPFIGFPADIYNMVSSSIKPKVGTDNSMIDLESVKLIGRSLLGDSVGTRLLIDKKAPDTFIKHLRFPSSKDAILEYKKYDAVLTNSFGPRRFVKMELNATQLYEGA